MTYMSSDRPWSKDIAYEMCFIIRSPPMYRIRGVSSVLVWCYQWMVIIQMPGVDLIRLVKILVLNGIWIRTHEALMISFICKPQNQIYSEISIFNSLFSSLINNAVFLHNSSTLESNALLCLKNWPYDVKTK